MASKLQEESATGQSQTTPIELHVTRNTSADPSTMDESKQIDDLVSRWQELEKQGMTVSPEDLCGHSPNLLTALRRRIGLSDSIDASKWQPPHDAGKYSFLSPPQQADELGRLGDYRVLKVLGSGGMGLVFLAEDTKLQRQVALKVLRTSSAGDATASQRFLREARMMAKLEHDHIAAVYQVGEDRGVPFLAMPLLRGETLESRLHRQGSLPIEQVVSLGRQMAQGLAAAHGRGMIHRDIKPSNIWLEAETDRVKVLDFGLARAVQTDVQLTSEGAMMGTPAYMAPEQASGKPVDARTDLFSLGCVLYQMCTGRSPFKRDDLMSTLRALELEDPADPSTLSANIPALLSQLILQLLSKNPARRPASATEVVAVLQSLEKHADVDAEKILAAMMKRGAPKRRPFWPSAAAVLLLCAAAGLGWHFYVKANAVPEPVLDDWIGAPGTRNQFGLKVELIGARPAENSVHGFLAGDRISFRIETDRTAFVGIWSVNLDGGIVQLFPNKHEKNNLLLAGESRVVPGLPPAGGTGYNIVASVDKGIECFRVVASTKNWKEFSGMKKGDFQFFTNDDEKKSLKDTMRGALIVAEKEEDPTEMSEVVLKYLVKPR